MSSVPDMGNLSLLGLFREEVCTHLALFAESLSAAVNDPGNPKNIEPLMRAAHSMKGAARIVNIESAVIVAGGLENALVPVSKGSIKLTPEATAALQHGCEVLNQIAQAEESEFSNWLPTQSPDVANLVSNLKQMAGGQLPASSPSDGGSITTALPVSPTELTCDEPAPTSDSNPSTAGINAEISLLELFREEVRNYSTVLNEGLVQLEEDAGNPQKIEPLMRAAHSIKGAARIVNLDAAVQLSHALEDAFVAAQKGKLRLTSDDIDVLLRAVDMLGAIAHSSEKEFKTWTPSRNPTVAELVSQLTRLASGTGASTSATMTAPPISGQPATMIMSSPGTPIAPPANFAVAATAPSFAVSSMPIQVPMVAAGKSAAPHPAQPTPGAAMQQPTPTMVLSAASVVTNRESLGSLGAIPLPQTEERVVRVTAQSLSRLMSLAGESLVEARWLQPFAKSLSMLKQNQDHLAVVLDEVQQSLVVAGGGNFVGPMLGEARQRITECRRLLADRIGEFETHARQSDDLNSRLYHEVIASRMRPFADGVQGFPRMVRDLARKLGKKVKFEILGHNTDVDRDILEKLEAPLNHILRNALDHGLETPEQRGNVGKSEQGLLRLEARHRAGMLSITVSDDGRGISLERLRKRIVERGLSNTDLVANMGEAELLSFLFLPGFSTSERVTEVSGRGVGLDVVHNMVTAVGGTVRVASKVSVGTTFHLQLPITLSVLRAVLVTIGDEPYAFPHNRIDRLLRLPRAEIRALEGRQYFSLDGRNIGLVMAPQVFEQAQSDPSDSDFCVVLISDHQSEYGVIVDTFEGEQDLVVRPLDTRLGKVPNVSAAALLEDGAPVLIVDVDDFLRSIDSILQGGRLRRAKTVGETAAIHAKKRILVVDDSITVREAEKQLLVNRGYDVETAIDGMDGWNTVRDGAFDLVVSDIDMPRMNGLEFVKNIKQDSRLKSVPVVIVSYKGRDEDRMKGLEAGADYYLTKASFHNDTLLDAVLDLIGEPE